MTPSAPALRPRPLGTLLALFALLVAAVLLTLTGCGGPPSKGSNPAPGSAVASTSAPAASGTAKASAAKPSGMTAVAEAALPAEARDVIRRIEDGAAFQYRQDGVTFDNREGRLPAEPRGYYREYTVATPGAADRGARRLILGRNGELYYTPDHYRTFQRVQRGGAT